MADMTDLGFLSVPQSAIELGVSGARVIQLITDGELRAHRLGRKQWAIMPAEIQRYKEESQRREASRTGPGRPRNCAPPNG